MRWPFKVLPLVVFAAVVLAIASARWLPESRVLERSVVIAASPEEVYEHLAQIRKWRGWYVAPGVGRFEGPALGAGGTLIIEDQEAQELRRLEITGTSTPSLVKYRFPEKDQTPYDIEGRFELRPRSGPSAGGSTPATEVVSYQRLRSRANPGSWMALAGERWFLYLLADRLVGPILERELHNLKGVVEDLPPPGSPR